MREDPCVEIRRKLVAVVDVAAARIVVAAGIGARRLDDLMVGEDVAEAVRAGDGLLADGRERPVGADDEPRAHPRPRRPAVRTAALVFEDQPPVAIA